jgi:hypothetical protein
MNKLLVILAVSLAATGCSSAPKVKAKSEQYCDLKTQTVSIRKEGKVVDEKSIEVMECNDNRIQRLFQVQSGMAPNCGEFTYWTMIGGKNAQRKGVSCQRPDGNWEVVNTSEF